MHHCALHTNNVVVSKQLLFVLRHFAKNIQEVCKLLQCRAAWMSKREEPQFKQNLHHVGCLFRGELHIILTIMDVFFEDRHHA